MSLSLNEYGEPVGLAAKRERDKFDPVGLAVKRRRYFVPMQYRLSNVRMYMRPLATAGLA